jgi:hypothetical protein
VLSFFKSRGQPDRTGISLGTAVGWRVSGVRDPEAFFKALPLLAGVGSVLALHDPQGRQVQQFLQHNPASESTSVKPGTIWPRPKIYHVECSAQNLEVLEELASRHAPPEIAMHVHLYRGQQVLLEWYDAFGDPIEISAAFAEDEIRRFCHACDGRIERVVQ